MSKATQVVRKYLCIHGHFYQPPRENPWLNRIEFQPSALPYHDWNERITRECYGPNVRARLMGEGGRIRELLNNYAYMSFNFGPTLLSWLANMHPWIYDQIISADGLSRERYGGHGNALAQVYNHIIMPLASQRDKLTQIRWGLADFKHRFGRPAEGMWLAETAVDSETLRLMANEGVKFTILSPDQAGMVRRIPRSGRTRQWKDVSGGQIEVSRPYRVSLHPSGNTSISVFFYHGFISRAVAYEQLLASGEKFLERIQAAYHDDLKGPQLISVATDGESYGHHFKFGDMALSWLFDDLKPGDRIILTNYGEYLERFPPEYEVKIVEKSSWSCAHGVGRWCSDCGCTVNHTPGWNQSWRAPLREGLDWLAGEMAAVFEKRGQGLFKDPWQARDDYISLLLDASTQNQERFLTRHAARSLTETERLEALQLLASQRMSLFMFTSCGWFFDDISGLEATQVLRYAARGIDLVRHWSREDLESRLMDFLSQAHSNDPAYGNGAAVYGKKVSPSRIDPSLAVANYALAVLGRRLVTGVSGGRIAPLEEMVVPRQETAITSKGMGGIIGEAAAVQQETGVETRRVFLACHDPERGFVCSVGASLKKCSLEQMAKIMNKRSSGTGEELRKIFAGHVADVRDFTIRDLIPDIRNVLLSGMFQSLDRQIAQVLGKRRDEAEELVNLLQEAGGPLPEVPNHILSILIADEVGKIAEMVKKEAAVNWEWLDILAKEAGLQRISFDDRVMKQRCQSTLCELMARLDSRPTPNLATEIVDFLDMCRRIGVEPDLWECRNTYYDLRQKRHFEKGPDAELAEAFMNLGDRLGFLRSYNDP